MENIKEIIGTLDFMIWGYILFKIWEYITPQREMKASEKYIEMLIVGLGIDKVASVIVKNINLDKIYICLLIAISTPFIFIKILENKWIKSKIIKTLSPTAWDFYFNSSTHSLVKVHFKDGSPPIVGWFGESSFVSSYPHSQDIYIQAIYKVTDNKLDSLKKNTMGILVRFEEVLYLEFIKKTESNNNENGGINDGQRQE